MLVDSHCHLPKLKNKESLNVVLEEARLDGVGKFINIGTSLRNSAEAARVAAAYADVFSTISVYPHEELGTAPEKLFEELLVLSKTGNPVAVGETGLDISEWSGGRSLPEQITLFEELIKLALDLDLPIVIHNRNADEQVLKLLNKYKTSNLRGVAHCFSSTWETAQKLIDLNFLVSFSGMITYPSRRSLLEVVERVSMDMFLVETDSPYLPPQGHRGEENQPKYVKIVAEKIAQVKQKSLEEIAVASTANACRLFKI